MHTDRIPKARDGFKFSMRSLLQESLSIPQMAHGEVFMELRDARTGELQDSRHVHNLITNDASVLAASMFASGRTGTAGLIMLAVGTGATGAVLSPDAPDPRQRKLNNEIARKGFTSTVYRTSGGAVSSVMTNVVDFTVTFNAGEAVGPLNEMGLLRTISDNPAVTHPNPNAFPTYDPTVDLSTLDVLVNFLTFSPISKATTSILSITWRLSF